MRKNRKPLLKHTQIIRLTRILDMLYKPRELAEEIGVSLDTIYRSYLPAGLPHTRERGDIWIYGPAFVAWAKQTIAKNKRQRAPLPEGTAWCVKCNGVVEQIKPRIVYANPHIEILQSKCPTCGGKVNRARAHRKESAA